MFENDYDLMPRTYSVKSYRKRQSTKLWKFFKYLFYLTAIAAIIGITLLSKYRFI